MPPHDEGGGPVDSREGAGAERRIEQGERCAQREQHDADVHLDAGERGADDGWHETPAGKRSVARLMPGHRAGARCRVPRLQRPRHRALLEWRFHLLSPVARSRRGRGREISTPTLATIATARRAKGAHLDAGLVRDAIGDHAEEAGGRERAGADAAVDGNRHQDGVDAGAPCGGHADRPGGETSLRRSHCGHQRGPPKNSTGISVGRPSVRATSVVITRSRVRFSWAMPKK